MKELSNPERRKRLRQNIERKIRILESYSIDGFDATTYIPSSIAQFRAWEDESLDVFAISSPNSMNLRHSPHNRDLISRADDVIRKLKKFVKPKKTRLTQSANLERLQQENKSLKEKISGLGALIHELRNQVDGLQQSERAKGQEVARLRAEVMLLRKKLSGDASPPLKVVN